MYGVSRSLDGGVPDCLSQYKACVQQCTTIIIIINTTITIIIITTIIIVIITVVITLTLSAFGRARLACASSGGANGVREIYLESLTCHKIYITRTSGMCRAVYIYHLMVFSTAFKCYFCKQKTSSEMRAAPDV